MKNFKPLYSTRYSALALLLAAPVILNPVTLQARPFIPPDKSQVLEILPYQPGDPSMRQLRQQRDELKALPENIQLASDIANQNIALGRAQDDSRYFGYAQAALAPWWNSLNPPSEVLLLRATIRESLHDFTAAMTDLETLLRIDQGNADAWLMRAIILQVQGDYRRAKQSCTPLAYGHSWRFLGAVCATSVASFNGKAAQSYKVLNNALATTFNLSASDRQWAFSILADIAARLGDADTADMNYRQALALGRNLGMTAAYADFLLDQGRAPLVLDLLGSDNLSDNLLLLRTLAEQAVNAPPLSRHVHLLSERFAATRLRRDNRHWREEARFTLHLLHQPKEALKLAQDNWAQQHEPEDARILLEAALAAEDFAAAQPVLKFMKDTGLEDVRLHTLAAEFKGVPI